MSEKNVEVVRRAYAEFEKGNFWVPELFHPSVRIRWLDAVGTEAAETVGLERMSAFMMDWLQSWDQLTMTAERIVDAGDQVVVIAAWRGRGKTSGVATEWRHGTVVTLEEGKMTSLIAYREPSEALKAAGLSD